MTEPYSPPELPPWFRWMIGLAARAASILGGAAIEYHEVYEATSAEWPLIFLGLWLMGVPPALWLESVRRYLGEKGKLPSLPEPPEQENHEGHERRDPAGLSHIYPGESLVALCGYVRSGPLDTGKPKCSRCSQILGGMEDDVPSSVDAGTTG